MQMPRPHPLSMKSESLGGAQLWGALPVRWGSTDVVPSSVQVNYWAQSTGKLDRGTRVGHSGQGVNPDSLCGPWL